MQRPARSVAADESAAFALAGGSVALFAATVIAGGIHMRPSEGLVLTALVAAAGSIRVSVPAALALGMIAWSFLTGFVVNNLGELRIQGIADWARLATLLACTTVVACATRRADRRATTRGPVLVVLEEPADGRSGLRR